MVCLTDKRRSALFPAEVIVRDCYHLESPTRREQDLNLRSAQNLSSGFIEWSYVEVITTAQCRHNADYLYHFNV